MLSGRHWSVWYPFRQYSFNICYDRLASFVEKHKVQLRSNIQPSPRHFISMKCLWKQLASVSCYVWITMNTVLMLLFSIHILHVNYFISSTYVRDVWCVSCVSNQSSVGIDSELGIYRIMIFSEIISYPAKHENVRQILQPHKTLLPSINDESPFCFRLKAWWITEWLNKRE